MSAPRVQVLMSFAPSPTSGNYFILDDTVRGKLDNATYLLAPSTIQVDVSPWLTGQLTCSRGRSRETDQFTAGTCTFTLRNENRYFDPTFTGSPFYPGIQPLTQVQVLLAGNPIFVGFVNDTDIGYQLPTISTVTVTCIDAFSLLANYFLASWQLMSTAVL